MKPGIVWYGLIIAGVLFLANVWPPCASYSLSASESLLKSLDFLWWWHLILVPFYLLVAILMPLEKFTKCRWAYRLHEFVWEKVGDFGGCSYFRWGKVVAVVVSRSFIFLGIYFWRMSLNDSGMGFMWALIFAVVFILGLYLNSYIRESSWDKFD